MAERTWLREGRGPISGVTLTTGRPCAGVLGAGNLTAQLIYVGGSLAGLGSSRRTLRLVIVAAAARKPW